MFRIVFFLLLLVQGFRCFYIPETTPTPVTDTTSVPPSPCGERFNFREEEDGKFTGPSDPNSLRYFNRTLGIVKRCFLNGARTFLHYPDQDSNIDMVTKPLQHGDQLSFDMRTFCGVYALYLRDCRSYTKKAFERSVGRVSYIRPFMFNDSKCGLHDCPNDEANATYPLNIDAIWQVKVSEGSGAMVIINHLEIEQATDGACKNDYITVYGDTDHKVPTKMCGNVNSQQFYFQDGTTRLVTVKFQSNHANNTGLFKGGIYVFPLRSLNGSGSSGTRIVPTRVRRVAYNGDSGPDDKPGGRVRIDESKDDDEKERSEIFSENSLNDYVPLVNGELEDEVVDCFHAIVSHGHAGAQKYLNSLAHPICHLFAKEFEKNGYVSPDM